MRIDRKRSRKRHALTHAAGQLVRIMSGKFRQIEIRKKLLGAPAALGSRDALNLDAEHDVFGDGPPGQQEILLQHEGDVSLRARDSFAVDEGFAFTRRSEAGADIQKRALAAAARPYEGDHFAVPD
jgi:hypothetical protein